MSLPLLLVLCLTALPFTVAAQPEAASAASAPQRGASVVEAEAGEDHFVAGGSVRVLQPVAGDLVAAGGRVDVDADVGGAALIAGGDVRVRSTIGDSLYVGGGQLALQGRVARNARIAGGRVELDPRAEVDGNLSVAGGQVRIEGTVKGYVQAAGGHVLIDGPVAGNVTATGGRVELGPRARIGGKLRYASRAELRRDPLAQVTGPVERIMSMDRRGEEPPKPPATPSAGWGWMVWMVGLMLLAAVLVAALPNATARVAGTLRSRFGMSLLVGFISLVCVPMAALLLAITLVGLPLALLVLVLYAALLLVAYVLAGIALGDGLLAGLSASAARRTAWRIVTAALAVLAISLLARLPWVGGVVAFAALLAGIGAMLMQVRPGQRRPA